MIDAKLLCVVLKDDYGDPARGESYELVYFYRTLEKLFRSCRLFDFGPYLARPEALQADLLREAGSFRPDVVFFTLFEDQFAFGTLDRLRESAITLNWFCDDQWRFEGFSRRYAPHFSWVVTTDPFALDKYRAAGLDNALLSQWATNETAAADAALPQEYEHDVSFIGGINPYRKWLVSELERRGIPVACYGFGWPGGKVSQTRMTELFRSSRINLNLSNSKSHDLRFAFSSLGNLLHSRSSPKTKEQIKGRHFEIGAWGGFQLTNYVEFLEDYFDIGKEIAVFGALDDLPDKIRFYLANDELRRSIAAAGYRRVRQEHTYEQRFRAIFRRIGLPEAGA